jgi:hypothetical protein
MSRAARPRVSALDGDGTTGRLRIAILQATIQLEATVHRPDEVCRRAELAPVTSVNV